MTSILVIEDEKPIRRLICVNLQQRGFHVTEAENAEHALEILKTTSHTLVMLDMQLPTMTGEEFLKAMQQDSHWRTIPVIITSASIYNLDTFQLQYPNVAAFLVKPFAITSLLETVTDVQKVTGGHKAS